MRLLLAILVFGSAGLSAFAQTPVVVAGGVLNAASSDKTGLPLAPGSLVSIYGTNLVSASASAGSIPLPYNLSDASVTFNGVNAPMLGTAHGPSYDQLNVQIPWEAVAFTPPATNGTVRMVVTRNGAQSDPFTIAVTTASPGIFTTGSGPGQAIAYGNSDGIISGPVSAVSHPIKIGDALVILATGLGPVDQTVASGNVPASGVLARTLTTPIVLVGNVPGLVVFSGLSPQFVGVYQINIVIAAGTPTGNTVPLQILMNGITTRNDATIAVSQ
ncbi:MAG: hypothetical protein P4L56_27815 [Candidatus Sulfopaludibacter sp.]|nr:hypothetical protein [Candidatus Sulfopaludibacter sp.]